MQQQGFVFSIDVTEPRLLFTEAFTHFTSLKVRR